MSLGDAPSEVAEDDNRSSRLLRQFGRVAAANNANTAITGDTESVTFAELGRRAAQVAAGLTAEGLAGQRVALLVTQDARWLAGFFGILLAKGVAVPLSHLHPEAEQRFFIEASGARAIVVSEDLRASVHAQAEECAVLDVERLQNGSRASVEWRAGDHDTALILYTSGTTGKPKGALITHGNLGFLAEILAKAWQWAPSDTLLHALPLHHLHGLGISLLVSLLAGGKSRMLARFEAHRIWEEMASATVLMGVPTMHKKLFDAFDRADETTRLRWRSHSRNLRLVTSGSAALPLTIGERWRELTGSYPLERFGMTEIGVGLSNPLHGERIPGTCGLPLEGMQVRLVGETGSDVGPGEAGEIWIRGPSVFSAYDANDQATRDAFADGWFKSGDTALYGDNGYVKILGRTSVDILKSGGYKLSALEIEEVLREHSAVVDVAVVGIPDETWGEIAVAVVQQRGVLDEAGLRAWCKERIAPYKVPKRVLFVDDFPRNAVGKVVKPELIKRVLSLL